MIYDFENKSDVNRRILCDTGEANKPEYVKHLKSVLVDEKATISDIILTHWHYDHIGGVKDVLKCLKSINSVIGNSKSIYHSTNMLFSL